MMNSRNTITYGERELLHSICHIVEHWYIERQLSISCPGYTHYIEKVKDHYFGASSKAMPDSGHAFTDIINTLLLLVRYPANLSDDRKKQHAPHIRFFARALTTGINSREDTYTCIESIYNYLKATAEKMKGKDDVDMDKVMEDVNADYADMKERFAESDVEMSDEEMK